MRQLLSILTLLTFASCNKDFDNSNKVNEIKLPDYSENGNTTYSFLLNDSVWTNYGHYYRNNSVIPSWRENKINNTFNFAGTPAERALQVSGRLTVVRSNVAIKDLSAAFSFVPVPPFINTFLINGAYPRVFNVIDNVQGKFYGIKSTIPFVIQVTKFDTIGKVCSGRFNGILYNDQNLTDSVIIKDGRFNVKLP